MGVLRNNLVHGFRDLGNAFKLALLSRYPYGTNIFEKRWDLLIILDSCRYDIFNSLSDEYDFLSLEDIERIKSIGGATPEWTAQTFTERWLDEIQRSVYVTAAPWPYRVLCEGERPEDHHGTDWAPTDWSTVSRDDFLIFDPAFEVVDETQPNNPNRVITDRAIHFARNQEFERFIVHYVPPHYPYDSSPQSEGRSELEEWEAEPIQYLQKGGDQGNVLKAYKNEIRTILDEIKILLNNIDAETAAISADHGEAFGEFGIHDHRSGSLHPKVRNVPWAETSAVDKKLRDPDISKHKKSDESIDEQLEALGYL